MKLSSTVGAWLAALVVLSMAAAEEFRFQEKFVAELPGRVREILKNYDPATGQFGDKVWNCREQNCMYPLAVAYVTPGQHCHKDSKLLAVIVKAGDALIEAMDANGAWEYRKKDNIVYGMMRSPWVYARWIMTFALIGDDMPPQRREAWRKALTLGYTAIARNEVKKEIHNIPSFHAMGLYQAGLTLARPEWCRQAADFLMKVVAAQSEGGYWKEGGGPLIEYNFVYIEALGHYYGMSHDRRVLPALEKAAAYHAHFTYPDGKSVETIDQRNPFNADVALGNVGFSFSPVGRTWLQQQWAKAPQIGRAADLMAAMVHHGEEGPMAPPPARDAFILRDGGVPRAAVIRRDGWFVAISAFTTPVSNVRWHQDRQNLLSIFHDVTGLILGGGNTKLQPAWSNFTVGDVGLLVHRPGDARPNFIPPAGLFHVPSAARLVEGPEPGLDLTYGPEQCRIGIRWINPRKIAYRVETTLTSGLPVAAHLTLLPQLGKTLQNGSRQKAVLDKERLQWSAQELAGTLRCCGCCLTLPATATLAWPKLPHNPYVKDGHAEPAEGRIVITLPFDAQHPRYEVLIEIQNAEN
jgi:hypothetical protein